MTNGTTIKRPVLQAAFGSEDADAVHIDDFTQIPSLGGTIQIFYETQGGWKINRGIFNVDRADKNVFRNLILDGGRYTQRPGADFGVSAGIRIRTAHWSENPAIPGHPQEGNCTVTNSVFRNIRGAGVLLTGGEGHTVDHCTFSACGYGEGDTKGGSSWDASSGALTFQMVQNVAFHHNKFTSARRAEGFGIKLGGNYNRTIKVHDNDFHLCDTQAYRDGDPNFDMEFISNSHTDIDIYKNTFRGTISLVLGDASRRVFWVHENRWLDVNGVKSNPKNKGRDWAIELGASNCLIENNYFQGTGVFIIDFGADNANVTVRHNLLKGTAALADINGAYKNFKIIDNRVYLGREEIVENYETIPSSFLRHGYKSGSDNWLIQNNLIAAPPGEVHNFLTIHRGATVPTNLTVTGNRFQNIILNVSGPAIQTKYQGNHKISMNR